MNRRVAAGLLALALLAVLGVVQDRHEAPFTTFSPGPTINVLGSFAGKQILQISGHQTYPDTGGLRLVTVYVSRPEDRLSLWRAVVDWIDPNVALVPKDALYDKGETNQDSQAQSAVQMTDSQDDATAAALSAAGIRYTSKKQNQIIVGAVDAKGPSAGLLEKDDAIIAVAGKPVTTTDAAIGAISGLKPGTPVSLGVLRAGAPKNVTIRTGANPDDPTKARVGISLDPTVEIVTKYQFPFKVTVGLGNSIGGPSAGMMFALSIYDLLTPGSLTGGKVIAGSGEIKSDGVVGPIGGIGQKLIGAERDGARLFLVAKENCAEAAGAHVNRKKMRLVEVHTLSDAIKAIDAWRANPDADLPRCG
ncbi:MAG: PDZ domain-containing protein [Marmoricola sp.]